MQNNTEALALGDGGVSYEAPLVAYQLLAIPAFGRSRDISHLLVSSQAHAYLKGVLMSGFAVWSCFMIWVVFLIIFKRIRSKKIGFLSGNFADTVSESGNNLMMSLQSLQVNLDTACQNLGKLPLHEVEKGAVEEGDAEPEEVGKVVAHASAESATSSSMVNICRFLFIASGTLFFAFLVLVFSQGLMHVQETAEILNDSSSVVHAISIDVGVLVNDKVPQMRYLASSLRESIQIELDRPTFCPAQPALGRTVFASDIRTFAYDVVEQLKTLDALFAIDKAEIDQVLQGIDGATSAIKARTGEHDLMSLRGAVCFVVVAILPLFLMAATLMAHEQVPFRKFEHAVEWMILPLFILLVVFAWSTLVVALATAAMAADFCLPDGRIAESGPDQSLLNILQAIHQHPGSMTYQLAEHIMSECVVSADIVNLLEKYQFETADAIFQLADFIHFLQAGHILQKLAQECQRDLSPVQTILDELAMLLDITHDSISSLLSMLSCDVLVPLYNDTVKEGICTHAISALYWVLVASAGLATTGAVMITLRAACRPNAKAHRSIRM
ncbi:hypothetical protein MPSEU_000890600 [Mayamaea pseudoterrestris]|nr:hypothetical protein MPSEU_000890600 [Mayamaea pseudoterrestris]